MIDGRHMLLKVIQSATKTWWGIPQWGLGNFEVFNTHPTSFVTLPIHSSPSLSLLLPDLSYWYEILITRIELIFWIVGQHLTRQLKPKSLKALPILLLNESLWINPPPCNIQYKYPATTAIERACSMGACQYFHVVYRILAFLIIWSTLSTP